MHITNLSHHNSIAVLCGIVPAKAETAKTAETTVAATVAAAVAAAVAAVATFTSTSTFASANAALGGQHLVPVPLALPL